MASRDVQILGTGSGDAPLDYKLPLGARLLLKAVRADFDGSGASGPYLPTLKVFSDAGHVIATCPVSTTVAAGASAEGSWFPGGRLVRAGSVAVTPVAFVQYSSGALPAGATYPTITAIHQTVPGAVTQGGAGVNPFLINIDGVYLFQLSSDVANTHATAESVQFVFDVANSPNFLSSDSIVLSFVIPPTGTVKAALPNGSVTGDVFGVFQNECDLRIECSNSLTVNAPYLVVSQLSTGQVF